MSSLKISRAVALLTLAALFLPFGLTAADPPDTRQVIDSVMPPSVSLDNKVVYVDFWATWCPPCRRSFPWMRDLTLKYREDGFEVVTVNLDERPASAAKFMKEMEVAFPVFFDSTGALARLFSLEVMPTSFLYDREGKLRLRHEGFDPKEAPSLDSLINALLEEKPKE